MSLCLLLHAFQISAKHYWHQADRRAIGDTQCQLLPLFACVGEMVLFNRFIFRVVALWVWFSNRRSSIWTIHWWHTDWQLEQYKQFSTRFTLFSLFSFCAVFLFHSGISGRSHSVFCSLRFVRWAAFLHFRVGVKSKKYFPLHCWLIATMWYFSLCLYIF